jgi:hypothetical protein
MNLKKWNKPIKGEWASTLVGYIQTLEEKVSPEWKKVGEVMESFGLTYTRGGGRHVMLADMCRRGILEMKKFRIIDITGRRIMPINHYRIVKKPSASAIKTSRKATASSKSSPSRKHTPR